MLIFLFQDVTTLVRFDRLKQTASVQLSNLSGNSVLVPPDGLICQIQACDYLDDETEPVSMENVANKDFLSVLNKIEISDSSMTRLS